MSFRSVANSLTKNYEISATEIVPSVPVLSAKASNSNDGSAARFFVGLGATCPSSPPFGYRFGLFSPQQQQEQGTEEEEAAEGAAAEAEEQEQEEVSG